MSVEESRAADLQSRLGEYSAELKALSSEIGPDLETAAKLVNRGICQFKGFCSSNPAKSCLDVVTQEGVDVRASLPDGKYWIQPQIVSEYGFQDTQPMQITCLMSANGGGWMLLFDDSRIDEVRQEMEPALRLVPVRELLAYTPHDIQNNLQGRHMALYYVDPSDPQRSTGKTPSEIASFPWGAQDGYGRTMRGDEYPERAKHYRFKYVGQPAANITDTLLVLDDGNLGAPECRQGAAVESGRGTCFLDKPNAKFAQTCYNSRGLISFGCSNNEMNFTQCGTCRYSGDSSNMEKSKIIRKSVVQKLYAR
jgi:hypothetical protein